MNNNFMRPMTPEERFSNAPELNMIAKAENHGLKLMHRGIFRNSGWSLVLPANEKVYVVDGELETVSRVLDRIQARSRVRKFTTMSLTKR